MGKIDELRIRFGLAGELRFQSLRGDFVIVEVRNRHAEARIALQGAQVLHWQPAGAQPVIWLSDEAQLAHGKSIRGGVPVCWPWFGPHASDASLPAHGYARTTLWAPVQAESLADGSTELVFEIEPRPEHRSIWPYEARVRNRVRVGESLRVELITINESSAPLPLSQALHTYFRVGDIESVEVRGLDGCDYFDKVGAGGRKRQVGPVTIADEVDRIYLDTGPKCQIRDPILGRRIHIACEGSRSTVVWNPWQAKADRMGDLGKDGFRRMLCVETANAAEDARVVAPGEQHRLAAEYRLMPL